eukprot:5618833-Amphidinium_carterae.1
MGRAHFYCGLLSEIPFCGDVIHPIHALKLQLPLRPKGVYTATYWATSHPEQNPIATRANTSIAVVGTPGVGWWWFAVTSGQCGLRDTDDVACSSLDKGGGRPFNRAAVGKGQELRRSS